MAGYLAAGFPGDYYSDDLAKSMDFAGYFNNKRQQAAAMENQKINRDMALEDLFMSQQENPLKLRRQELDNQGLEAMLPGKRAQSEGIVRDNQVRQGISLQEEQALARAVHENKITATDLETADKQLELALRNSDPAVRKQAEALLPYTKKLREIYAQAEARKDLERVKGDNAQRLAQFRAGLAASSRTAKVGSEKQPNNVNAYIAQLRNRALSETNPEKKQAYIEEAQSMATWLSDVQARSAAARQGGQVDAGAVANLPTKEVPPAPTIKSPQATTPKAGGRITIYKGGKAIGTVPESQKDQALKEGYTLN